MLKIWGRVNSINVQKAMWTVGELGLPHERIDAGMAFGKNREDWYLAMNPNGLVPTMDDDGLVLWESNTIARYLAAKHDAGGLWPSDPAMRARAEMWMDWQLTTLLGGMQPLFWQLIRTPPDKQDRAVIDKAEQDCLRLFAIVDQALADRPYLAGDRFTVGDIPVGAMTYRWYNLPAEHGDYRNLQRWYDSLQQRPAYQQHVMLPLS
jgi:glutathione S-transferase